MGYKYKALTLFSLLSLLVATSAQSLPGSCGPYAWASICQPGYCCSKWGFCGTSSAYCDPENCQSQCPSPSPPPPPPPPPPSPPPPPPSPPPPPPSPPPPPPCEGISCLISNSAFEEILPRLNNDRTCGGKGFYSYETFITAARSFPNFGNTGDIETRKRDIAAFLTQTSTQSAGYCLREYDFSGGEFNYCVQSEQWPCVSDKQYYARGPFTYLMEYNYIYGPFGATIGQDLLTNPELVATDPLISIKSAIWIWMTPRNSKPSCHNVMVGNWVPSPADIEAGRFPGFGVTTNIISSQECGTSTSGWPEFRAEDFRKFCDILGVSNYGDNLTCENQTPFGSTLLVDTK